MCNPKTATLLKAESLKPLQKQEADQILPVCNTNDLVEALTRSEKARKHHALQGKLTSLWVHALNKQKSPAMTEELYN